MRCIGGIFSSVVASFCSSVMPMNPNHWIQKYTAYPMRTVAHKVLGEIPRNLTGFRSTKAQ